MMVHLVVVVLVAIQLVHGAQDLSRLTTLENARCSTLDDCDDRWALGGPYICRANSTCGCTENSKFNERLKTCTCDEGFVNAGRKCLAVANALDFSCEIDMQCTRHLGNNTTCYKKQCTCTNNTVRVESVCLERKALEQSCEKSHQCVDPLSMMCQDGFCVCIKEYTPDITSSKCLKRVDTLNEICEDINQCSSLGNGTICRGNKCVCKNEYFFHTKCLMKKGLGQKCNTPETGCYLEEDGDHQNVKCIDGKCACSNKTVPDNENKKCVAGTGVRLVLSLTCMLVVIATNIVL